MKPLTQIALTVFAGLFAGSSVFFIKLASLPYPWIGDVWMFITHVVTVFALFVAIVVWKCGGENE